jgi:hypothetical protein
MGKRLQANPLEPELRLWRPQILGYSPQRLLKNCGLPLQDTRYGWVPGVRLQGYSMSLR